MPEEVIENQLEHVRKDYGPGTPNLTAKAAIEALGKTVVSARVTPEEVIELARKFAGREDFADLIKLASLGTKARDKANARKAFHNLDQETRLEADLFDQLGRAVTSEVFAADLARTLKVATVEETNTVKSVTRIARSLMGD
ncbi:hypothetical protein, partial [Streptomyces caniscabiei]|uniref:hypothetical protein n=1 Tax=Streptomyces caniscabiei TaxID=2746961 RepID=UPI0038F6A055